MKAISVLIRDIIHPWGTKRYILDANELEKQMKHSTRPAAAGPDARGKAGFYSGNGRNPVTRHIPVIISAVHGKQGAGLDLGAGVCPKPFSIRG